MTTIAISKTEVAADGMRTWGDEIRGLNHRKLIVADGAIYSFTGLYPMFSVMIDWHRNGARVDDLPKGADKESDRSGWTLIIIDREGVGKYSNTCPYIERFEAPIAFGAGQDYAMGAMLAGASAREAVKIVASLCNHTGGTIQVVNIAEALGLAPVREAAE